MFGKMELSIAGSTRWQFFIRKTLLIKKMTEQQVARKAQQMLQTALRGNMSQFGAHISAGKKSIREATATASLKKYGEKGMPKTYYLRKIGIRMERHGFVQHFGVDTLREGGERTRQKPRSTSYRYRTHRMRLVAKPFIDQAVEQSGIVDFVMKNITQIRNEQVFAQVKSWLSG